MTQPLPRVNLSRRVRPRRYLRNLGTRVPVEPEYDVTEERNDRVGHVLTILRV